MRIAHFRVQNYKIIDDTGDVPADPKVTALVGKNESGKTGILRSIWKSHNVANAKFYRLLDYPRERYAAERRGVQQVVSLTLNLEEADLAALKDQLPSPAPEIEQVIWTVSYEGEDKTTESLSFSHEIEADQLRSSEEARIVVERLAAAINSALGTDDPAIVASRDNILPRIPSSGRLWDQNVVTALTEFQTSVNQWRNQNESRKSLGQSEMEELEKTIATAKAGDPLARARKWARDNLPTFIYFDDYGQLETKIHLPTYIQKEGTAEPKIRTQTALFAKASLDPQEILDLGRPKQNEQDEVVQRRKDKRSALLESASFNLTGEWTKWWPEKLHRLHFSADGEDLVLRVSDEHNPASIPFEERSQGFQWFFSFYLVFLVESARAHKDAILLLDEPGLHLHPKLQESLVAFFNNISEKNQIIYSTHLPFLVDGNRLDRVRTVHLNNGSPRKTIVANDVRPIRDSDTLFPLQAAIGYSIAQTLFLGKRSVILEGITDYWLIKGLNDAMIAAKETNILHNETVLIPVGGTSRLMPLASIMFGATGVEGKNLLVLLDSDTEGGNAKTRIKEVFGDDSRVMMLGEGMGMPTATIEDLLPRDLYVEAVKATTGKSFNLNKNEMNMIGNVAAVKKAFNREGFGEFGISEKVQVALKVISDWGADLKSVPSTTIELGRKLFAAINARF